MNEAARISAFARVDLALAWIVVRVATRGGHSLQGLRGESKDPGLVAARRTIVREAWAEGFGLSEIGRALNRDHSTVFYHVQKTGARRRAKEVQYEFLIGPLFDSPIRSPSRQLEAAR